jgi:folate-binding protein YgfZ
MSRLLIARSASLIILYSMAFTALQDALRAQTGNQAQPLAFADYRGATTAARFTDPQQEFASLRTRCGVYDLGFSGLISVTGGDRVRWMNGMVTNNIRDLAVGSGVYAFLLNPQGRILGDMHVFNRSDSLIVETDRSQIEKIVATFDHYIIMDDVGIVNEAEKWTALGVAGPKARATLNAVGIEVPELQPLQMITPRCNCDCGCVECLVVRGEDAEKNAQSESYEIWLAPKDVYKTWEALVAAGAAPVGSETLELQRILDSVPLYGVDIRERDLPQETEQMRALNFDKGCYVGQEIVERIRSRGNVHRKLTGFVVEGTGDVVAGAKISSDEKEVGEITSVTSLATPGVQRRIALGYIRREVGVPGREVAIGAVAARVIPLPMRDVAAPFAEDAALHKV